MPVFDTTKYQQVSALLPRALVEDVRRYSAATDLKINAICKQALTAYLRERGALSLDQDVKKRLS